MLGIDLPNEKYILEAVAIQALYMSALLAYLWREELVALALLAVALGLGEARRDELHGNHKDVERRAKVLE